MTDLADLTTLLDRFGVAYKVYDDRSGTVSRVVAMQDPEAAGFMFDPFDESFREFVGFER